MKKIISGIIMVLLAGFCFGQNTLIVVPLQNQDYVVAETEVDTLTTLLENAIRRTQRFDVVDRGALEDLMREHQFQMSDWSSDRKSVQMGRVLNANYIVRGMVSKLGSSLFVTGRVLDVNTAKILDDAEMQTTMNEAYNKMRNFVKELTDEVKTEIVQRQEARTERAAEQKQVKDAWKNKWVYLGGFLGAGIGNQHVGYIGGAHAELQILDRKSVV
jgi:TolB-like protein